MPGITGTDRSQSKINESVYKSEYSLESDQRYLKRKKYYEGEEGSYIDNESQVNICKSSFCSFLTLFYSP